MPRNGSGVYSKPSGTTAVANTTIESSKFNQVIDDIVADLNAARPVVAGGTGVGSLASLKTALSLGTMADQAADAVAITGGSISGLGQPVRIADGGTSVATAGSARTVLGLEIGTDVQAFNAYLADIAGITPAQGNVLYFNGTDWVALAPGTAGQVLKTNGAGANPSWGSAGGVLQTHFITTSTLANSYTSAWRTFGTFSSKTAASTSNYWLIMVSFWFSTRYDGAGGSGTFEVRVAEDGTQKDIMSHPVTSSIGDLDDQFCCAILKYQPSDTSSHNITIDVSSGDSDSGILIESTHTAVLQEVAAN